MSFKSKVLESFSNQTKKYNESKWLRKVFKRVNWLMLKLGATPIVVSEMRDGTRVIVDLSTRTERDCFYTGLYDANLIELLKQMLQDNSTFSDVGANIGFYSVAISNAIYKTNKKSKVLSFEPYEGNFKRLQKNIEMNNFGGICRAHNFGLSDTTKTTEITLREDFKNGSSTGNASVITGGFIDKGFRRTEIKLKTLDDVWDKNYKSYPKLDLIKLDIEGHEDFFLKGANGVIQKHRPTLLMEINKPYYESRGVDLDDIFMPLIPKDYLIFRENNKVWGRLESLHECKKMDNVFIVPKEKLANSGYHIFNV